jgi:hypothetical protein
VQLEPALFGCVFDAGAELAALAAQREQERGVGLFDMDAAVDRLAAS